MATATKNGLLLDLSGAEAEALCDFLGACAEQDHLKRGLTADQSRLISGIFNALSDASDANED